MEIDGEKKIQYRTKERKVIENLHQDKPPYVMTLISVNFVFKPSSLYFLLFFSQPSYTFTAN